MTVEQSASGGPALPELEETLTRLFGDRAEVARRYAEHLSTTAVERGLVGPREVPRVWDRHIFNCGAVGELLEDGASLVDVGSGAGLPGLVLAIARPGVDVTLVEPLKRRVEWLEGVTGELGLTNVRVVRARAEESGLQYSFDTATARAVASLDQLATWCLPLVKTGGRLLALKGQTADEELSAAEPTLRGLGAVRWSVRQCGVDVLQTPTTVVEVVAGVQTPRPPRGTRARRRTKPAR